MTHIKHILVLTFSFITVFNVLAQEAQRMVWGQIPENDLKMTVYAPDPDASAVVLGKIADLSVENVGLHTKAVFRMHRRVKLFKKDAFESEGRIELPYIKKENFHLIESLKAQVIQPDGSVIKVSEKDFKDEVYTKGFYIRRVFIPNLKEGAIMEYEYELHSKTIQFLHSFYFQEDIPVRQATLFLTLPDFLQYDYLLQDSTKKVKIDSLRSVVKKFSLSQMRVKHDNWVFAASNLDAMTAEPFITTTEDYITKINFKLTRVSVDLDMGGTDILISRNPFSAYDHASFISEAWTEFKKTIYTTLSRPKDLDQLLASIEVIQQYLLKNIAWNGSYSSNRYQSVSDILKTKKANSAELNLLMIACLQGLGVDVVPVMVSTRDHGKVNRAYPELVHQYNHLLCLVKFDNLSITLDVSTRFCPATVPRINVLNNWGYVIAFPRPYWANINPSAQNGITVLSNVSLQTDGSFKGTYTEQTTGYNAIQAREALDKKEKTLPIKKELMESFPELVVDSIVNLKLDSISEPFKQIVHARLPNALTESNDIVYLKPLLRTDFDDNPFKQPKRLLPVDMPFPFKCQYIFNLTLPSGYTIEEMPKSVVDTLGKNAAVFSHNYSFKDNLLQLIVKIQINKLYYPPKEYPDLKRFFDAIAAKRSELVVLKKK
jgi:Domain of Unknown Function with PDB structure (DUF3857)